MFLSAPSYTQGVVFEKLGIEEALAKAAKENKHVFIDCYTSWCGPCKRMDAEVFPRRDVGDYFAPRFIAVKYDVEKEDDGKMLKKEHGVTGYPTYLILNPDGSLFYKFSGALDPPVFIRKVDEGFDDGRAYASMQKAYEKGGRNKELLKQALDNFTGIRDPETQASIIRLAGQLSDKEKTSPDYWFIYAIDLLDTVGSKSEQYLFDNAARFRRNIGRDKVDPVLARHYTARLINIVGLKDDISAGDLQKFTGAMKKLGLPGDVNAWADIATALESGDMDNILKVANAVMPGMESSLEPYFYMTDRIMDNGTMEQKKAWLELGDVLSPRHSNHKRIWLEGLVKLKREQAGL